MTQDARAFNWDSIGIKMITVAAPALGANPAVASTTVPTGKKWLFVGAYYNVTGGAAAFNALFAIDDGTATHNMWDDTANVALGTAVRIRIGPYNYRVVTGVGDIFLPSFMGIEMPAGYSFRVTGTTGDDQWAASYFFYKEVPA